MASRDATTRLQFLWNASHTFLPTIPSLSAFYMQQFNQFAAEKDSNLAEAVKRKYCSYCGNIFLPGLNSQVRIEKYKKRKRKRNKEKSVGKVILDHDLVEQPKESNVSKQIKQEKNSRVKKRQVINVYPSNHNNNSKSVTTDSLLNNQNQTQVKGGQHYKNYVSYVCNSCNRETRFVGSPIRDISTDKNQKGTSESITSISKTSKISLPNSPLLSQDKRSHGKKTKKQKKIQLQQLLAKEKKNSSSKRDDFNDSSGGLSLTNFLSAL